MTYCTNANGVITIQINPTEDMFDDGIPNDRYWEYTMNLIASIFIF
jgi:hypothetical protein